MTDRVGENKENAAKELIHKIYHEKKGFDKVNEKHKGKTQLKKNIGSVTASGTYLAGKGISNSRKKKKGLN